MTATASAGPDELSRPQSEVPDEKRYDADVIVVGAGPSGSAAAYWMASAGLDVLLLEKTTFPRDKVCGDGLTPRGTRALVEMGIDVSEEAGWLHNRGLRVIGGGQRLHLDWPDLTNFPPYGLVRPRADLDALLANQAVKAGARLHEQTTVSEPLLDAAGQVIGVTAKVGPDKSPVTYRAPVVLSCDGVSSRMALALGVQRNDKRPMGVAVRRYYTSPRTHDDYLESWLELWDGPPGADDAKLLPGYGWIFGMGDGTVNVGLGVLNSSAGFQKTDYRQLLTRWLDNTPEEWGLREQNATCPTRGAGLPMGFNRTPHYSRGMLLVGDSGGSVNPFNGEGIPYAMESGKFAAQAVVQAMSRPEGPSRERALQAYPEMMAQEWGAYYRLGGTFVKLIGNPAVMRACTRHGLPHPGLMRFVLKLLANLNEPHGGDLSDRVIQVLTKITPAIR
ncbi:geranylgeranyl reductase family protein [Jatrophihabitans sp. GAS493]|uniref:geranylgeranyl reductase family protein n=1 Tax=Jatrophihabitans sp. GAS493 TaxID=1907575 RepID=UPI000BB86587|nr:geranylgeranyl reductase family protein [Jatrophihabitans sp. GAS493]SOD72303.1 geranylgeranyl reductase family protein [Jatrophihabitans sp. GAS493]